MSARKSIVRIITFLAGLFFLLEFLMPGHVFVIVDIEDAHLQGNELYKEIYDQFGNIKGKSISFSTFAKDPPSCKGQILVSKATINTPEEFSLPNEEGTKVRIASSYIEELSNKTTEISKTLKGTRQVYIKYCFLGAAESQGYEAVLLDINVEPMLSLPAWTRSSKTVPLPKEELILKRMFDFSRISPRLKLKWEMEKKKIVASEIQKDENKISPTLPNVNSVLTVLAAMAFMLGPINLIRSNVGKLVRGKKELLMPILFIVGLLFGLFAGTCGWIAARLDTLVQNPSVMRSGIDPFVLSKGEDLRLYFNIAIYGIGLALGGSSMGMLAFYLVSAAYRAFRLNNLDAGVMMAAATIVLLGMVPLGGYITPERLGRLQLSSLARWIMDVPNSAVQRAVLIGAVAGVFGAGLRQWLGLGKAKD